MKPPVAPKQLVFIKSSWLIVIGQPMDWSNLFLKPASLAAATITPWQRIPITNYLLGDKVFPFANPESTAFHLACVLKSTTPPIAYRVSLNFLNSVLGSLTKSLWIFFFLASPKKMVF